MTVRRVVTPSGRGIRGYVPSRKMKRMIPYESTLERDAIQLFEYSGSVQAYEAQPCHLVIHQDGEPSRYTPDFRLALVSEDIVHVEVKPKAKLANPLVANRIAAIRRHHEHLDAHFLVLTEDVIRKTPRLRNLQLLAYHDRVSVSDPDLRSAIDSLNLLTPKTVRGATAVVGDRKTVYRLLAAGLLHCDLDQEIQDSTPVYLKTEGDGHAALFL